MSTPTSVRVQAPQDVAGMPPALAADFRSIGFIATRDGADLVLTRSGEELPDPNAFPHAVTEPVGDDERATLAAFAASYMPEA